MLSERTHCTTADWERNPEVIREEKSLTDDATRARVCHLLSKGSLMLRCIYPISGRKEEIFLGSIITPTTAMINGCSLNANG